MSNNSDSIIPSYTSDNWFSRGLRIRTASETHADVTILAERVYFDGGDVLVTAAGCFCFEFDDGEVVELKAGEILVLYPGQHVTIRSLVPHSQLNYVILSAGEVVAEYFSSFAFYNRLKFTANIQYGTFAQIVQLMGENSDAGNAMALSRLTETLTTFQHDLRLKDGAGPFFEAIRAIHANLRTGNPRLEAICGHTGISRSHLHVLFERHLRMSPGDFIRREQLRLALWQLTESSLPIKEIAARIGIPSPVYFTTFVRRLTGKTPSQIRKRGL